MCWPLGWGRILDLSRAQPAQCCRFVGEGVPLTLDARTVRVEGLADADHVQARLVGQLLHQCGDLLDRLAVQALLAHSPIKVFGHYSRHTARPRVHIYDDPGIPAGEVGHLPFHELPGAAGRGRITAEAKAEPLQLLHVAIKTQSTYYLHIHNTSLQDSYTC